MNLKKEITEIKALFDQLPKKIKSEKGVWRRIATDKHLASLDVEYMWNIIKELEAIVEMQETAIFSATNALLLQSDTNKAEEILILAGKKNIQLMKGE